MNLGVEASLLIPITALLPLTAILLVAQANPYQTLVLRGILGAVASLIYALLGAADVALTEALVGTLLSTTLYAVALRSSMVVRLAVPSGAVPPEEVQQDLRDWMAPLHLRLEFILQPLPQESDLHGLLSLSPTDDRYILQLHRRELHQRLMPLPGASQWQGAGHGFEVIAPAMEHG